MKKTDASQQAITDIFHLVRSGQLEQAELKCASMRINDPEDVNIVGLHGAVLLKLGQTDDAQLALQKTIELEPGFAKPHEDLGRLFLIKKEHQQAAHHFSEAIRLDGKEASAFGGLANALAQLGKVDEAKVAHEHFVKLSPVAGTLLEAERLLNTGDLKSAEQLCHELQRREWDNTQVLRMLARIASDDDRHVVAEGLLRNIIRLSPNEYLPYHDLGRFLVEQSRFPEAIEMFEHAITLNAGSADNYHFLGDALAVIGRSADALAAYRDALQLNPEDPHALAGQGHMLRIIGNRDEAVASYEKCTSVRPEFGDAWWNLASLKGYALSDEQIQTINSQISTAKLSEASAIGMYFALARAFEAGGYFASAWQQYELGNALKRTLVQYDPVQTEVMHDAIIEQFSSDFLHCMTADPVSQQTPIFILGMPRSGSTLLEQILASHSMVEGAGELPYVVMLSSSLGQQRADGLRYPQVMSELNEGQLESLGKAYIYHSSVHRKLDLPCFIDKMPSNFAHVGLIHMMLPNAKIIDARRHPMGTCVANYRQLYAQGKNQTYDLTEFAEYYLDYHRIMDHWQKVLPGRVLQVDYENVVADLEGQVRRMLDFCELPWQDACLGFHRNTRPVNTASAEQVREPIYTDAVDFWKHYTSQLESIREILAPVIPG
jgi:tetratricopeptide (TPR) repeat protein